MINSPKVLTEHLILRPISYSDAKDMFEYSKRSEVGPSAGWRPHEFIGETREVIEGFLKQQSSGSLVMWAVELKENNKMIGTVELYCVEPNFRCELGYSLNPDYWNKGYATEACSVAVKYAFEVMKLIKVEIGTYVDNIPSIRVAEKLGFIKEGILRKHYKRYYDSDIADEAIYGMTIDDYYRK